MECGDEYMRKGLKILVAFLLGLFSFPLLFFLGEEVEIPSGIPAAQSINWGIFIIVFGGYFFLSEYLLSRGNPQALRKDWPIILALTATLIVLAVIAIAVEPNRGAVMLTVSIVIFAVACSLAGAALAARMARADCGGKRDRIRN
jgi:uncharacterized membrane protein (UPF0136 family)